MSDEDIFNFFDLLEKYPDEVKESLQFMTSGITTNPSNKSKYLIKPNESKYISEYQKLMDLKNYFTGKMSKEDKNHFHDEIIEDLRFRSMFVKIQNALR